MEIAINCRFCGEAVLMPEELEGLEQELRLDVCDGCEFLLDDEDDEEDEC